MATSTTKGSVFIAVLTATDQLTPQDRRDAKRAQRQTRWIAFRDSMNAAETAYHKAMAAGLAVNAARWIDHPDCDIRESQHEAAAMILVSAVDRYVATTAHNKDAAASKARDLRTWVSGVSGSEVGLAAWRTREVSWFAAIAREVASFAKGER